MGFERIAPILVETEALAAERPHLLVIVDNFRHPVEAAEERGHLRGEIEEHLKPTGGLDAITDMYRRIFIRTGQAVRQKTAVPECPHEIVERVRVLFGFGMNENAVPEAEYLFRQLTGKLQA